MRTTLIVLLICIGQTFAIDLYSQNARINLNMSNATIKSVLAAIEDQSDFYFMYEAHSVNVDQKVTVSAENKTVPEILNNLFANTGITYKINNRQIALTVEVSGIIGQQSKTVSGKVTDSSGFPLPGVSVVIKGTTNGIITDADGNYSLKNVPEGATLVYSFVGMKMQEVSVAGKTSINVIMLEETIGLEEVVAIGYGTMKKSDLTGSVSSIKSDEINSFAASNILQALQGRSSGVLVKQNNGSPGGAISVRIRGTNSIQGSNEPLYVIDGFPSSSSKPTVLDNSNIESVEILKDASAVAIYGSRGANGVILITTKKGKEGRTTVDYEASLGFQSLRKKIEMMNATEYANFYNLQRTNDGLSPYFSQEQINGFGEGFDWQDFVFTTAPIQTHALTIRGGNQKTKFAILGNVFDQRGIIEGSGYKRYSITANIDHKISEKISVNYSSTLTKNRLDNKDWGGARFGASLISVALCAPPTLTPYNEDGTYRALHTAYPFVSEGLTNPLNYIKERDDVSKSNKVLANLSFVYKPIDGLTVKIYGGAENSDDRSDYYQTLGYVNSQGNASVSTSQFTSFLNENTINYNKIFGKKHNFSALAGFTYQDFITTSLSGSGSGYLSDVTETGNLGSANLPGIPGTGYSKSIILSYLARLNYIFNNRYFLTVNFRSDGSSKYSDGNKWGYFPSGAIAWKIKEENFMKDIDEISNLKLRSSYGVTGSQAIGAYATLNNLSSGKTVFGDALYTFFAPGTRLPGDLKWETTAQFDLGLDIGILSNRYNFTFDYYIKETKDLLNTVQLPSSSGFTNTLQNVGVIQNKGFEFSLDAKVLTGKFSWDINGNLSFNKSEVKKLYGGQDIYGGYEDMLIIADNCNLLREGESMSVFYGYLSDGYDEKGFEKYKDLNPDGVLTQDDKTVIGNPNPDFIYGLNSFMAYKGFELSLFFQGSYGNDLVNISSVDNSLNYGYGSNMYKEVYYDHWTSENTNAKYPKITRTQKMNFSDRLIEDGSFLRLRNIQLTYNLPVDKWNMNFFQNVRLYVSAQNYWTLTKYSGWDPEVNSVGGASSIAQGIDHHSYPTAKSFTFGINVSF
ncbi:MAG: SusC/RagA family TonB-linked outer membrane protein [Bacteroidetes bacterium GWF2_42_66]|nr:MAG: SusC/RagA family TonB-linked outer membrane protein [Bacteroidetes bacterium GWA2_42_15]OFX98243.1 MAG: SusC/RagA family TonB-linked outer membrane protein [Bacteroidetes bacterium GWE2_42_39]OFY42625.1 MAG: SusC/RagA family TonB-linked outer membrane protein [Bacteroidetes bacterium GWF2_42_66]